MDVTANLDFCPLQVTSYKYTRHMPPTDGINCQFEKEKY